MLMSFRVLIADDDPPMRTLLELSLFSLGIDEVCMAVDGDEALNRLTNEKFDLAIIDWNMPGANGLDVIRSLRSAGSMIPVIMVTGEAKQQQVLTAIGAGANDYVVKPFQPDTLRRKVQKFIKP